MKKMTALFMTLILGFFANQAHADHNEKMRQAVIKEFLKQANNPKSKVGKIIKATNDETSDGRNQEGAIRLPVTKDDLQAVVTFEETMLQPWHYASVVKNYCTGNGDSAIYIIYLSQETGVHAALEFETLEFSIAVHENYSVKILRPSEFDSCDSIVGEEENPTFGEVRTKIIVDEISPVIDPK